MTAHDPEDKYLEEVFIKINETNERVYYRSQNGKMLIASWKPDSPSSYSPEIFQRNALHFFNLIEQYSPTHLLVDCRYMGFEVTYNDHLWYINQTKPLWEKARIRKIAFVFQSNLAVQMSMEGLREVAEEEGVANFNHRIFESIKESTAWLGVE